MKQTIRTLSLAACLFSAAALVTIGTGCAGDKYSRSTGEAIDDSTVTAKVKSEMLADPDVKGMQVKVDTFRGQVQLTGFVDTAAQKARAEEIARNVNGVQWVKNDIVVKGQEPAGAQRNYGTKNNSGVELKGNAGSVGAEVEVNHK